MTLDEARACLADWKAHGRLKWHTATMNSPDGVEFEIIVWEAGGQVVTTMDTKEYYEQYQHRYLSDPS
jgi:hypothetical protein